MTTLRLFLRSLWSDRRGSTALEIALITAAIAVALVFALRFLQDA